MDQSVVGCSDFLLSMQIVGNHWILWTWGRRRQRKLRARRRWPSCRKPGGESAGFACSGFGGMRDNSWGKNDFSLQNATWVVKVRRDVTPSVTLAGVPSGGIQKLSKAQFLISLMIEKQHWHYKISPDPGHNDNQDRGNVGGKEKMAWKEKFILKRFSR